jgi:hypothetical protein
MNRVSIIGSRLPRFPPGALTFIPFQYALLTLVRLWGSMVPVAQNERGAMIRWHQRSTSCEQLLKTCISDTEKTCFLQQIVSLLLSNPNFKDGSTCSKKGRRAVVDFVAARILKKPQTSTGFNKIGRSQAFWIPLARARCRPCLPKTLSSSRCGIAGAKSISKI